MKQTTLIEGVLHRVIPEYPEEALREALVNAGAHRDYSAYVLGSQVRIQMYADRLEIISPGGLFGPVSLTNLETVQASRNQLMVRLLGEVGLVENRDSGIGNGLPFYRAYSTVLTASCRWLPFVHKPGVCGYEDPTNSSNSGLFRSDWKGCQVSFQLDRHTILS